jgi:hypothetical protein
MEMYDTEAQKTELRRQQERLVHAWMRAAAYAEGSAATEPFLAARERSSCEPDPGRAVTTGKGDNFALGQALISIGLIGRREHSEPQGEQEESDDLARSLMLASSIRSRLGEILLKAKRITSGQLKFALELQRHQGGLLGEILMSLGWLERETLDAALAAQTSGRRAA